MPRCLDVPHAHIELVIESMTNALIFMVTTVVLLSMLISFIGAKLHTVHVR